MTQANETDEMMKRATESLSHTHTDLVGCRVRHKLLSQDDDDSSDR